VIAIVVAAVAAAAAADAAKAQLQLSIAALHPESRSQQWPTSFCMQNAAKHQATTTKATWAKTTTVTLRTTVAIAAATIATWGSHKQHSFICFTHLVATPRGKPHTNFEHWQTCVDRF